MEEEGRFRWKSFYNEIQLLTFHANLLIEFEFESFLRLLLTDGAAVHRARI